MTKDNCIATVDWQVSSWSPGCRELSLFATDGQCSKEELGCGDVCWTWCLKTCELSGVGEPSGIALIAVVDDPLRSGTVATEKVSTLVSSTASHCPQHKVSASILQLRNFLFSSVLTCTKRKGEPSEVNVPFCVYYPNMWHFPVWCLKVEWKLPPDNPKWVS